MTVNKIKTGDWIVIKDTWRIDARETIKVTSKLVFWRSEHYDRPFRVRLDDVVFVGSREQARRVAEKLTSSLSRQLDEEQSARFRRIERDLKIVAEANAAYQNSAVN